MIREWLRIRVIVLVGTALLSITLLSIMSGCIVDPNVMTPSATPATQRPEKWDVGNVTLEETTGLEAQPAGLYPISRVSLGEPLWLEYSEVAAGLLGEASGLTAVIGCLGKLYPADSAFEVASLQRNGPEIRIVLRFRTIGDNHPGAPEPTDTRCIYLFATFPRDLPDGHYRISCQVINASEAARPTDAGSHATSQPTVLTCNLDLFDPPEDPVVKLSDQQLLDEYILRGTALAADAGLSPMDEHVAGRTASEMMRPAQKRWDIARSEIIRRGGQMVPPLIELLKREVPRNATARQDAFLFGFARDVMELLARINDPRPVPALVEIVDGFGGRANRALRRAAFDCLQGLTFLTFVQGSNTYRAMPSPDAKPASDALWDGDNAALAEQAAKYRAWLAGEGRDPAKWLDLARNRARVMMAGNDLDQIDRAVEFLLVWNASGRRDDDPDRTLVRLMEIASGCRRQGKDPGRYLTWAEQYGPRARPYVQTFIRYHDALPKDGEDDKLGYLPDIGGEEVMAYLTGRLSQLDANCAAIGVDRHTPWHRIEDTRKRCAFIAYAQCRWGIERWADGLSMTTARSQRGGMPNKGKSQERWLIEGVGLAASKADGGDAKAQYLIRQLLPDLPAAQGEDMWCPPATGIEGDYRVKYIPPFRVKWLEEHRRALVYETQLGGFRLPGAITLP